MTIKLQFDKYPDALVPAIVQDASTSQVLMLGFMNEEAFEKTRLTGLVTFFSRSRQRLWTKGETSGNFLRVEQILPDCDSDTLLIKAECAGPVCHTGTQTCFDGDSLSETRAVSILHELERVIDQRRGASADVSYVANLFAKGINKIAQKVGEEAVELVIEAKDDDDEKFKSEAADLLFHVLVLLRAKSVSVDDVLTILTDRRKL